MIKIEGGSKSSKKQKKNKKNNAYVWLAGEMTLPEAIWD